MEQHKLSDGFGVYLDVSKKTSGARFFTTLASYLQEKIELEKLPRIVLFNISGSMRSIIVAKLRRQKIVLRVDGLYAYRLSHEFLRQFSPISSFLLSFGIRFSRLRKFCSVIANLRFNTPVFFRVMLADHIIYQSRFSQQCYQYYFHKKPYTIILNGAEFSQIKEQKTSQSAINRNFRKFKFVTTYSHDRPAKGIEQTIKFVQWLNENKKIPAMLFLIGYDGNTRKDNLSNPNLSTIILHSPYIKTYPRFSEYTVDLKSKLYESDMYISLSHLDPCPNAVIEAMAHGLPVVGLGSGGVSEIVKDAGELIDVNDFENGLFGNLAYEGGYNRIDFEELLQKIMIVYNDKERYKLLVQKRFQEELSMKVTSKKYLNLLETL